MISHCPDCGGMRSHSPLGSVPVTTVERTSLTRWCACQKNEKPEQRVKYRTPDGIWHLWTQAEIDAHIEVAFSSDGIPDIFPYGEASTGPQEEARLTLEMLHNLLPLYGKSSGVIDQATKDDLLGRIERLVEPLREMVNGMEVRLEQQALSGLRRLAQEARKDESVEGGFAIE
jgi:hypothetical protein